MGEDKKDGLAAALDVIGPSPPPVGPFQLPLLPTEGALDGEATPDAGDGEKRGRGRPSGSRNKRTDAWVDYLLARYPSPLVVLAEIYSRPVAEIIKELKCSALEAFRLQLQAAEKLAPYVHQKQPVAIQIDPSGVVKLIIEKAAPEAFGDPGDDDDEGGGLVIDGKVLALPPADENGDKSTG